MVKDDLRWQDGSPKRLERRRDGLFVGGFVRDRLLGRENKDIDIEVTGSRSSWKRFWTV